MKKTIALSFLLFVVLVGFSQNEKKDSPLKGMYLTFKGGFSFPVSQSSIGSPRAEVGSIFLVDNQQTGEYSEKAPFGSRGAGLNVSTAVGYMFGENFGIEMEFTFLRSLKIDDASRDETNSDGQRYLAEQTSFTNMFRAAPMLVMMGSEILKVRPYAKFGLLVPLAGATVAQLEFSDETGQLSENILPLINPTFYNDIQGFLQDLGNPPIPTESSITAKTYGQFSVGFAARAGAEIKLTDKITLFGEMEMNMLTVKAKQTKITDFNTRVSDEVLVAVVEGLFGPEAQTEYTTSDLPEILRITNYENEITEDSNRTYDPARRNDPYEQLTFRDNYNSFGIMLGIKYNF